MSLARPARYHEPALVDISVSHIYVDGNQDVVVVAVLVVAFPKVPVVQFVTDV